MDTLDYSLISSSVKCPSALELLLEIMVTLHEFLYSVLRKEGLSHPKSGSHLVDQTLKVSRIRKLTQNHDSYLTKQFQNGNN